MLDKTNKEIIDSLEQYFLLQDPKIIARALAGMMIDINRLINIGSLNLSEKVILISRLTANGSELMKFIENGSKGNFNLHNIES